MAFDPSNPSSFFSNANNLSPDYTNDPNASAQHTADMQAALAWAQANPNQPEAAYYASTLQQSLGEQQNITNYLSAQTQVQNANQYQSYISGIVNKLANANGQNNLDAGEWGALSNLFRQSGGAWTTWADAIDQANSSGNTTALGGLASNLNTNLSSINGLVSSQVNAAQTNFANLQNQVQQGLTFAQPDYANQTQQLNNYWDQTRQNIVQPQQQDIYQTAYNIKNNIAEQMNANNQLNSGAEIKAKGGVNANAIQKDTTLQNAYNTQKQSSLAGLSDAQQQQRNQYQDTISGLQGNDLGRLLAGSANTAQNAYNTNTAAINQTNLNNAETQFQNKQTSDQQTNNIFNTVGNLAGTVAGSVI